MDKPSIPDGYTAFPDIQHCLFWNWQEWNLQTTLLGFDLHSFRFDRDDIVGTFQMEKKWLSSVSTKGFVQEHLGKALASKRVQATGIKLYDGRLVYLSDAVWRALTTPNPSSVRQMASINAAFEGLSLSVVERGIARRGQYYPILSHRALAEAFEAANPPDAPTIIPETDELGAMALPNQRSEVPNLNMNPAAPSSELGIGITVDASGKGHKPGAADNPEPQPDAHRHRGGRPTTHDWDRFWVEVALWTAKNDVTEPDRLRPELRRHMLDWVMGLDRVPDTSTVERKLAMLWSEAARVTPRN